MATTSNFRSDGKAIDVVVPAGQTVTKGDLAYIQGWHGVVCANGVAGDVVSLDISASEFSFVVASNVTANKGDILYLPVSAGFGQNGLNTTNTGRAVVKITKAKDANNVIWAKVLGNTTA